SAIAANQRWHQPKRKTARREERCLKKPRSHQASTILLLLMIARLALRKFLRLGRHEDGIENAVLSVGRVVRIFEILEHLIGRSRQIRFAARNDPWRVF